MAATVADRRRKRGAGAFLDEYDDLAQLLAKRGRCSPTSAARAVEDLGISLDLDPFETMQLTFPASDPELLRGYLEASGNVVDAAIRRFRDDLASGSETITSDAASSGVTSDGPELQIPANITECAELIVKEMSSCSDLIDAKNRAFRILELIEKSTASCSTRAEEQKMREEHKILKHMLGGLLRQNIILKRAFLVQHNRLKDYQGMVQERSQFKEVVGKYQKQIKALEDKNYVLSFHLAQSNKQKSAFGPPPQPGRLLGGVASALKSMLTWTL